MKSERTALRATYVRGGTSRAVIFRKEDLPTDQSQWKRIFQTVLGSPDSESKQLDGLGGGITSLSKVAILSPSSRAGIDVDYLFVQIEPSSGEMLVDANCGNISSAVGPFAVDEGWVTPNSDGQASVQIFNENTKKVITAKFNDDTPISDHIEISGVAGRGVPIHLMFKDPEGSSGDGAFPSGAKTEMLEVSTGRSVRVSLIDVTLPCAIVHATELGLTGEESYSDLVFNADFVSLMTEVRVAAAVRMGICETPQEARESVLNVPDVVVVSSPGEGRAGITARFVSCDRPHRAAPVTSSMALAAAVRIAGTIPSSVAKHGESNAVTIYHPSGTIEVEVEMNPEGHVVATSILRTARRIMQGEVLLPFAVA